MPGPRASRHPPKIGEEPRDEARCLTSFSVHPPRTRCRPLHHGDDGVRIETLARLPDQAVRRSLERRLAGMPRRVLEIPGTWRNEALARIRALLDAARAVKPMPHPTAERYRSAL